MSEHQPPYEGLLCAFCMIDMVMPASRTKVQIDPAGEDYPTGEAWADIEAVGDRVVEQARELLGLGYNRFTVNNTRTSLKAQTMLAGTPVCAGHMWPAIPQLMPKGLHW